MKRFTAILLIITFMLFGCAEVSENKNTAADDNSPMTDSRIYSPSFYDGQTSPYDKIIKESEILSNDSDGKDFSLPPTSTDIPAETKPVKSEKKIIKFLAAGDNIVHSNVYEDALERANGGENEPKYNFIDMYSGISDMISSADIAFINQETPLAGEEYGYSGYPNFNGPQEMGDAIVNLGFDIINIANNHMLDKWESGLESTTEYWKTKDVMLIGSYSDAQDYDSIRVYENNGVKISLLSYTYSTNGMSLTSGSNRVIPYINKDDITRQVGLAKKAGDLVFVSIHWGTEDRFTPDDSQRSYAQLMVDLGVDVVIGTHPHVVEEIKWAQNADGHKTLVIYSLGNLISTMLYSKNMVGGIVTFDIVSENGNFSIENPLFIPTMCHYNKTRRGLQVYRLEDYTADLCTAHGAQKYGAFDISTLKKYITDTISPEFLPDYLK